MKKKIIYILPLFLLISIVIYLSNLKYEYHEINADNISELELMTNSNYYLAYSDVINFYHGFGNIEQINFGIGKSIENKNNVFARYELTSKSDNEEQYNVYLSNCTTFIVKINIKNGIKSIYQRAGNDNCYYTNATFDKNVNSLITNGFVKKESKFKNGSSILIKDNNPNFYYVIHMKEQDDKIIGLRFELYNKKKFPSLTIF